jgi:hypothetical protein
MMTGSPHRPNFAVLLGLAWLLVLLQLMAQLWASTAYTFPDADDAMRLVEVRDFMAGQSWYDMHQARVAPPAGFDIHWSRLIDAGLVGLFEFFRLFVDPALAERLMLAVWPVLWLLPVMGGSAAIAWRLGGRDAACVTLLLAVFGLPGMVQFRPGRIDHHNIQITLAVLAIAAAVWSDRKRYAAPLAGAVTGLALAIGLESLALLGLCGAALALRYVFDPRAAAALRAYGLTLAGSTVAGFLATVGPDHWGMSFCEQLALNSTAAATLAGLGVALASTSWAARSVWTRCEAVGATAMIAVAVGLWLEPRCVGGPFAIMDPTVRSLWLMDIAEMQPLAKMLRVVPQSGIAIAAFPALGLIATLLVAKELRRDFGFLTATAGFLLACAATVSVIKFYSYAVWLGMPLVAVASLSVFGRLKLQGLVPRFAVLLLVTPAVFTVGAITLASASGIPEGLDVDPPARQACINKQNTAALARLPVGLIAANQVEWGPYLLAFTPHAVLAAPYQIRLADAIVAANDAFGLPPAQARQVIAARGVNYLLICGPQGPIGLTAAQREASLWGRLRMSEIPDWLTLVPELDGHPFTVYQVKP